eukprot:gene16846-19200_t
MKRQYSDAKEDPDEGGQGAPNMVSIKKADVPTYLHLSEFYLSLLTDAGDDSILVPEECMKRNDTVDENEDLHSLLLTLRFWVADSVCDAVLAYALTRPFESYEEILSEFYQDFPALKHIKSFTVSRDPMHVAIESGFISFVKYFLQLGNPWPENAYDEEVPSGEMDENGENNICNISAANGNLDCLVYAHNQGVPLQSKALNAATWHRNGLGCLKYLHQQGLPLEGDLFDGAVLHQNIEMIKYLHEQGCEWDERVFKVAVQVPIFSGCFSALRSSVCPDPPPRKQRCAQLCISKAKRRYFECFKYAHEYGGCELPSCYTYYAASDGQLEMLKYLHEQGCEWDPRAERAAEENNHQDCLEYITKHRATSGAT